MVSPSTWSSSKERRTVSVPDWKSRGHLATRSLLSGWLEDGPDCGHVQILDELTFIWVSRRSSPGFSASILPFGVPLIMAICFPQRAFSGYYEISEAWGEIHRKAYIVCAWVCMGVKILCLSSINALSCIQWNAPAWGTCQLAPPAETGLRKCYSASSLPERIYFNWGQLTFPSLAHAGLHYMATTVFVRALTVGYIGLTALIPTSAWTLWRC